MAFPVPPKPLDEETIRLLAGAATEIKMLRREIDILYPQVEAYNMMKQILGMVPSRTGGTGMGEDMVGKLLRFIASRDPKTNDPTDQKSDGAVKATADKIGAELDDLITTMENEIISGASGAGLARSAPIKS